MLRSLDVLKLLVAASVVTLLVLGGGALVLGPLSGDESPGTSAGASAETYVRGPIVSRGAVGDRAAAADQRTPVVRSAGTLPAYHVAPKPAPLQRAPQREPEPEVTQGRVFRPLPPPEPEEPEEPEVVPGAPFTFRVGTFNILGSQHTKGSKRWAPGTTRAGFTADLVNSRGLGLIGFQEVQRDQLGVLVNRLPSYGVWPAASLGNNGIRLQIAYRRDLFEVAGTETITTVFHRQMRPIPILRLRHRASGGEFYVMNIHNSPLGMQSERDRAKAVQIPKLNSLRATGLPVLLMGDANEKEGFFCRVGAATGMVAANGGSTSGGCRMPPPPVKIDWIMGARAVFSGYSREEGGLVARASDHAFIHSGVTLTPSVTSGEQD
ncbi:endonuclease/exonuclease/phosphatase family protein [Nocardioides sp.]|uniref:endonuclease/exonuclease/phosphatase family protein n=1 Tax=Nocardioides sp. TaxID=35761 RepID=UPI0027355F03|nr:endonuclease/exonuclease/phosphatase family protein [Nocardioides sp.]MDP3892645.1 hypothetical protein [Nocardioides sp.]